MDNYTRMKLSEKFDEDAFKLSDLDLDAYMDSLDTDAEEFKRKYKQFYTDIKLTIKEDW